MSRSLELLMRCHEFRCASSLCISNLFQHEYRSPNLQPPLLGPLQLLWFMWRKFIRHITTAENMKHRLSAIVTGITLCHLIVVGFYIPACNVQTTGFASIMLLSNSVSLSPSTHNWCSIFTSLPVMFKPLVLLHSCYPQTHCHYHLPHIIGAQFILDKLQFYTLLILVSQFHSGRGSFHKQTLECDT